MVLLIDSPILANAHLNKRCMQNIVSYNTVKKDLSIFGSSTYCSNIANMGTQMILPLLFVFNTFSFEN